MRFDISHPSRQISPMDARLNIAVFEREVAERAKRFDRDVTSDFVHVYESPDAQDNDALIVQIAVRRPEDREGWTQRRLRFSQEIRDLLLQHGDERYPLVQMFEPEEWALRND